MPSAVTITIESISEDSNNLVYRDILLWHVRTDDNFEENYRKSQKLHSFRFTELAKWLIDNHKPFKEEYRSSHLPRSYRLHAKRNYIQARIDDLVELKIIKKIGSVKAKKNSLETPLYSFTRQGNLLGQFIQANFGNGEDKRRALDNIHNALLPHTFQDSSVHRLLEKFLKKCKQRDLLPRLFDKKLRIIESVPLENHFTNLWQAFATLFNVLNDDVGKAFFEAIDELDEDSRKLLLFQFKLDIESVFAGFAAHKEWEVMRYQNIQNHGKVTLLGTCRRCGVYAFQLDIRSFLRLPFVFAPLRSDFRPLTQKIVCLICKKPEMLEIKPTWYLFRTNRRQIVAKLPNKTVQVARHRWRQQQSLR